MLKTTIAKLTQDLGDKKASSLTLQEQELQVRSSLEICGRYKNVIKQIVPIIEALEGVVDDLNPKMLIGCWRMHGGDAALKELASSIFVSIGRLVGERIAV